MKKLSLIIVVLFCLLNVNATYGQIITTVAGGATGHGGYWGEGGLATAAELNIFGGLAVDKFGNIYIAQGSRIVKVDMSTGIIHTVAGTGVNGFSVDGISATAAEIDIAGLVWVDSTGNFYFGDNTYRLRKVDIATGIITTFAGNGTLGFSGDGGPATAANFDFQTGTFDVFGNMIIESSRDHRIRKIDPSGIITTIAGTGITGNSGDGGLATAATMAPDALGICTDKYGNIYFSDSFAAVRKINVSTGIITRVAGAGDFMGTPYTGDGGPATNAHINPQAIAVDDTGNLYIADYGNSRIEKVDTFGIIHSIAGNGTHGYSGDHGPATAAEIYYPENVTLDACNNVYIADFNNARVRKVTYPPNVLNVANTITASPGDTVCTGTSVIFTATATSGVSGTTYSYLWYKNGVAVSTGSTYTYTPANGDSVQCVVTGNQQCSGTATVSSNSIYMVVNPYSVPTITITAPASAPAGSTVTVNATVTGAGSSYHINWYDNAVLINTTAVPVVTYVKGAGVDVITATVVPSSEGGCYDSTTSSGVSVVVDNAGITTPQPSPGEWVTVYPNPAHEEITIKGQHMVNVNVSNLLGQTFVKKDCGSEEVNINISTLPYGVYAVKVTDSAGNTTITKIVKQ